MRSAIIRKAFAALALCTVAGALLAAELPEGWIRAGSHPAEYEMGVDRAHPRQGRAIGYVKGIATEYHGFGTLMQMAETGEFLGKRVRFSADLKTEDVDSGWAGIWFRVDGERGEALAFDNMQDRALRGSTDWKHVEIVLEVPREARALAFGLLLRGGGQAWMDRLKFEVVGVHVPVTGGYGGMMLKGPPRNLDFSK
ncbi:MAG TPA: hypothetical protein VJV75_09000 [Candidatus Polarisedimenticolia bacterium]|nr:hypothetical protein [Candidatus Polarisedimenticolia bacterium]